MLLPREKKKILIFHHDESFRMRVVHMVVSLDYFCEDTGAETTALELLENNHHPILISEFIRPQTKGIELIKGFKSRHPEADVLVVIDQGLDHSATDILKAGSSDFVNRPLSLDHLAAKLYKMEREKVLLLELHRKSITDGLTGLYDRRFFFTKLDENIKSTTKRNHDLSLIMLDVHGFKRFNNKFGHTRGDSLLRLVSSLIQSAIVKPRGSGFRYGGDEFTIILPQTTDDEALIIGKRITENFKERAPEGLSLTMGIAQWHEGVQPEALVSLAKAKMSEAKREANTLISPRLESHTGHDDCYIQCANCGHMVHWAAIVCDNCLVDPRRRKERGISEEERTKWVGQGAAEERRKGPRIKLRKTFMYDGFQATIIDIAQGGLQIKTRAPVSVGQVLTIAFTLPDRLIRFKGNVVHAGTTANGRLIAGVTFDEISEDDASAVAHFIRRRILRNEPDLP